MDERHADQRGRHENDAGGDHGGRAEAPRPQPAQRPAERRHRGGGQQVPPDVGETGSEAVSVAGHREQLRHAEIADRLTLSPFTVKTHVNHAMTKWDARDRAQLVVIAYQAGLRGPA
ncbi:helix-turn-helix transcriptional regulator [Actinoplanes teichomyceticus]|uniref:helix-turn-helix transcriptional regulator n=1 Tax=Actinoplanes teichomyceticus TaxID=1867 RepID=UPI0027DC8A45|nr:LuxR C-terminal-related transcriptional regulator [Actinoplanes teichomyceticus]